MARKLARKTQSKQTAPAREPEKPKAQAKTEIAYDFIKSNFFRVVKVDGAFGGIGPSGSLHMSVYNERQPIPQKVVHQLIDGKTLGPEIAGKRESRQAMIREVEVDLVFDLPQAIAIREWLDTRIAQLQKLNGVKLLDERNKGGVH